MQTLTGESNRSDNSRNGRPVGSLAITLTEARERSTADARAREAAAAERELQTRQADRGRAEALVWQRILVPNPEGGIGEADKIVANSYDVLEELRRGNIRAALETLDPTLVTDTPPETLNGLVAPPVTDELDLDFLESLKAYGAVSPVHHLPPYSN